MLRFPVYSCSHSFASNAAAAVAFLAAMADNLIVSNNIACVAEIEHFVRRW